MAEDRKLFREAMDRLELKTPKLLSLLPQKFRRNGEPNEGVQIALNSLDMIGLPAIIRPAFTLGGTGGGVAYNRADYGTSAELEWMHRPMNQILVDNPSWLEEFEMEVVRDSR